MTNRKYSVIQVFISGVKLKMSGVCRGEELSHVESWTTLCIYRYWQKWSSTSSWQCAITSTTFHWTCQWHSAVPSYRESRVCVADSLTCLLLYFTFPSTTLPALTHYTSEITLTTSSDLDSFIPICKIVHNSL